ncbi:EamA family transporter [Jannaschia sp. S6380]|uniref:aromatic amino acid exporter YddG n=1 Tax=Jannaschia sp. S6380 TaxID=2926408 RepID=UPI001FF65F5F|nr:EamA family transporter [Jannaschia sp. S6380]MCK0168588.1 EamA family transporter [Jannaschia sp. S6380]
MSRPLATLAGFGAVMLWALLALFTALTGDVPPLQLLAMCFAIGGGLGLLAGVRRRGWRAWRQPWPVWAVGVGGLFGYHLLYVLALRAAPPVEASLIAYLWPLLIVLFATMATGERLRAHHVAGAVLGLLGAGLIVTGGRVPDLSADHAAGYAIALAAAFVWAGYSVLSRRLQRVRTDAVTGFCLATSLLATIAHLALEPTVAPRGTEWLAILGLGLGPVGLAFFLWDVGVKRGDLPVLGAASYAAPLLSTLVLIGAGQAEASWVVGAACILITGGAVLAAKDLMRRR